MNAAVMELAVHNEHASWRHQEMIQVCPCAWNAAVVQEFRIRHFGKYFGKSPLTVGAYLPS
jgi:hypothetical protein